ncbi:GIN domain-containing protein [Roseivirga sp.]|uniref:GIN domain-containing protein n=1 Tax=Roseivirga sp. TaxID=1964215 RepID=UPI003B8E045D
MKNLKIYIAALLLIITNQFAIAQVKGNGQPEMRAFDMKNIEKIVFNVTVDAEIDMSVSDELFVSVDNNLFDHMVIKQKGNTLYIDQKDWISPSENIKVIFGAQGLKKLKNTAWGHIRLINVDQGAFDAQMNVGTLQMVGKLKEITVSTNSGKVDLSKLQADKAKATINGNGRITLNANEIDYKGESFGQLIYLGSPKLNAKSTNADFNVTSYEQFQKQASVAVEFVDVKLKNNTLRRRNIKFQGPIEKPFGYGAPIGPKAVKNETLPVGTRIYQENALGKDKLLVTITKANAGKVVKLFKD